jgi:hypothetical protein
MSTVHPAAMLCALRTIAPACEPVGVQAMRNRRKVRSRFSTTRAIDSRQNGVVNDEAFV